jgi:hypothetical protein
VGFRVYGAFRSRQLEGARRHVVFKLDSKGDRRWDYRVTFDRVDRASCKLRGDGKKRIGKVERRSHGLRCSVRLPRLKRHFTWRVVGRYHRKDRAPDRGRFSLTE